MLLMKAKELIILFSNLGTIQNRSRSNSSGGKREWIIMSSIHYSIPLSLAEDLTNKTTDSSLWMITANATDCLWQWCGEIRKWMGRL
mmetsp:Transcript_7991/g.7842  ORF Transcript_7991/g.7842 Transcript_7991/m.7842 type:complete len:87 (-) Transcript_7991:551-811(-)